MPVINYYNEDYELRLPKPRKTATWIKEVVVRHRKKAHELNFIFCSDSYLHKMNIEYLGHSTYTDIITFDNSETEGKVSGDIFISVDRVKDNAEKFQCPFMEELHRVMIHGVLHLLGYSDKGKEQKDAMRMLEDKSLRMKSVPRETFKSMVI